MKISILTPTIRAEGLPIVSQCLAKQTNQDFEWLIGSSFEPDASLFKNKWVVDDFREKHGGKSSINRIYNKLIKESQGEILVSIQDWIWFPADALDLFLADYEKLQAQGVRAAVSGVGDQYGEVNKYGKPDVKIWSDPRKSFFEKSGQSFYECFPEDIEANFCYYPRQLFYEIGGWDEALDFMGVGMDNVSISHRADACGWKFYLDQGIECRGYKHDVDPRLTTMHNMNGNYQGRLNDLMQNSGDSWYKLEYLD